MRVRQRETGGEGRLSFSQTAYKSPWQVAFDSAVGKLVTAAFTASAACESGSAEDGRRQQTERDSAGVRLVLNEAAGSERSSGAISFRLTLDVGGVGDGDSFYRLRDGRFLPDGAIVVAEETRVTQLTSQGHITFTVGRRGEGPGEFRGITSVAVSAPQEILVMDSRLARISTIKNGAVTDVRRVKGVEQQMLRDIHVDSDGTFVLGTGWSGRSVSRDKRTSRARLPYRAFRISKDGDVLDTIGPFPGPEISWVRAGGMALLREAPLGKRTSIGLLQGHTVVGTGDSFEVSLYDPSGRKAAVYRVSGLVFDVDRRVVEAEIAARLDVVGNEVQKREVMRAFLEELPDTPPAYADLKVTGPGEIWLRQYPIAAGEAEVWHVLAGETGRYCGAIQLPEGFSLWDVGQAGILGRWVGSLGEERVRLYEIVPFRNGYGPSPTRPSARADPRC